MSKAMICCCIKSCIISGHVSYWFYWFWAINEYNAVFQWMVCLICNFFISSDFTCFLKNNLTLSKMKTWLMSFLRYDLLPRLPRVELSRLPSGKAPVYNYTDIHWSILQSVSHLRQSLFDGPDLYPSIIWIRIIQTVIQMECLHGTKFLDQDCNP